MFTVTRVRKELSSDASHRHIAGVCSVEGNYYTRAQVVASIMAGNVWKSYGGGTYATIKPLTFCPASACSASPYITTAPDHTTANNLENLPPC